MLTQVFVYLVVSAAVLVWFSITIIQQGHLGVCVFFGKYKRLLSPGLNWRIPFVETVHSVVSTQNRSVELAFQAITRDQANVNFKTLMLYAVRDSDEETIKRAAFRFVDNKCFMQAFIRSVEGSIRAFVATKDQSEILVLRHEIVNSVKAHIDEELTDWGFHLINLQVNDISFDEAIMRSMAQVVASNNMRAAAQNEAQAQFITKTRVADAEAQAKRTVALADKDVERLRGEGNALLRSQMAEGLASAGKVMEAGGVDPSFMLYTMWLDSMKFIASHSHGNILSFDGSMDGFDKTMRQMKQVPSIVQQRSAHATH